MKNHDRKVTGKAEPGSKITVKSGTTVLGYANPDKYGNFSATLKKAQKAGTVLSVTTADKAVNLSSITKVIVTDKIAPNKLSNNSVKDYDKR